MPGCFNGDVDFLFRDEGSIALLRPLSEAALEWREEYMPQNVLTWGEAIVIEPRYVRDFLHWLDADGYTWRAL